LTVLAPVSFRVRRSISRNAAFGAGSVLLCITLGGAIVLSSKLSIAALALASVAVVALMSPAVLVGGYVHSGVWITDPTIAHVGSAKASAAVAAVIALLGLVAVARLGMSWSRAERRFYSLLGAFSIYGLAEALVLGTGASASLRLAGVFAVPFFLSLVIRDEGDVAAAVNAVIAIAAGLVLLAMLRQGLGSSELHAFGENRIVFGRTAGVGSVIVASELIREGRKPYGLRGVLLALFLAGALLSGSRGAVVAAILAVSAMAFIVYGASDLARRVAVFCAIGCVFVIATSTLGHHLPQTSRLLDLAHPGTDVTSQSRLSAGGVAVHQWESAPITGMGPGSFHVLVSVGPKAQELDYPHNMVLELLSEEGVIGLILIAAALVTVARAVSPRRRELSGPTASLVAASLFFLITAQFSGDLDVNRHVWTFTALLLAALRVQPSESTEI
jgi:O-Antigen ligase